MTALRPTRSLRPFVPRSVEALAKLSDEDLVLYVAQAKATNRAEEARTAMQMLLYRHESWMRDKVRACLPRHLAHLSPVVEEWVLERLWHSALKLALEGSSPGEWRNWCKTTLSRQVISFFRSAQGQALERETAWPGSRDDDDSGADTIGDGYDEEATVRVIETRDAWDVVYAGLPPAHQRIIDEAWTRDRPSKDVAADLGETVANVDQVRGRFRKALRSELEQRGIRP